MTDKRNISICSDQSYAAEEGVCCKVKQLCSDALKSKKYTKLIKKMVSQGFNSDWNVTEQIDWLQTRKEVDRVKFLSVFAFSWICEMGGIPSTNMINVWKSLITLRDRMAKIIGKEVGSDLCSLIKGLEALCEKAEKAVKKGESSFSLRPRFLFSFCSSGCCFRLITSIADQN